jgi:hypothetical protein
MSNTEYNNNFAMKRRIMCIARRVLARSGPARRDAAVYRRGFVYMHSAYSQSELATEQNGAAVKHYICVQYGFGSNFSHNTGYPGVVLSFPQYL